MVDPDGEQWPIDERKALRLSLKVAVMIDRELHVSCGATLIDISCEGCRLVSDCTMPAGTFVSIAVPPFSGFKGWIAWSRSDHYGIDFAHALPAAVVAHIATIGD